MNKRGLETFQNIRELIGDSQLLDELERAMSSSELEEMNEHIIRNYDLDIDEE